METVDEGIGSNDSTPAFEDVTPIFDKIKHTNGQSVLSDSSKHGLQLISKMENGTKVIKSNNGVDNSDAVVEITDETGDSEAKSGNVQPLSNDSAAPDLDIVDDDDDDDCIMQCDDDDVEAGNLTNVKGVGKELTNHIDNDPAQKKETDCFRKTGGDESKLNDIEEVNLAEHSKSKSQSDAYKELPKDLTNDDEIDETETQNDVQDSKLSCNEPSSKEDPASSSVVERPQLVLNQGVRNSLKGLVDKVKLNDKRKTSESDDQNADIKSSETDANEDDLLQSSDELQDGILMEISGDEDDLLCSSPKSQTETDHNKPSAKTQSPAKELIQKNETNCVDDDVINISDTTAENTSIAECKDSGNSHDKDEKGVGRLKIEASLEPNQSKHEHMEIDSKLFQENKDASSLVKKEIKCNRNSFEATKLNDSCKVEPKVQPKDEKDLKDTGLKVEKMDTKDNVMAKEIENDDNDDDDDDDDVIFEGETKSSDCDNALPKQTISSSESSNNCGSLENNTASLDSTAENDMKCVETDSEEKNSIENLKKVSSENEIDFDRKNKKEDKEDNNADADDEDDDVIFEGESKPDESKTESVDDKISALQPDDDNESKSDTLDKPSLDKDNNSCDNMCNTNSEPSDKKRHLSDNPDPVAKRPKLDQSVVSKEKSEKKKFDLNGLINKLGSRVEPVEVIDSDNEENVAKVKTPDTIQDTKPKEKMITISEKVLQGLFISVLLELDTL